MAQRPALAFSDQLVAAVNVRRRKNCTLVVDITRTYWSVPNERLAGGGSWSRGAVVEIDEAPAHGLPRPLPFYDWSREWLAA